MDDTQDPGTPPLDDPLAGNGTGKAGIDIQAMLGQLQGMIVKVAHASEPALREVAAKAAELAAVAGERAGPIAHTLADKTEEVGHSVAGKATGFASSIRSAASRGDTGPAAVPDDAVAVNDPDVVGDPAEDSPLDGA